LFFFWKSVEIFVNASVSDAAAETVMEPESFALAGAGAADALEPTSKGSPTSAIAIQRIHPLRR
jgi:hypothetical protein